jgi:2,3-bisphosphoglycerate-independent phosphoglycerate mutase
MHKLDETKKTKKKYVLVIIDGAADYPIKELGQRTPLEVARKPWLDKVTTLGRFGTVQTVPAGFSPGSDVAIMSLLGYNPAEYYTGRAPLEAAAQNLQVKKNEWVFRCNLVHLENAIMKDHSAGNISTQEAQKCIALLNEHIEGLPVRFYSGVSYRNLMFFEGDMAVTTTPPHDILEQPIKEFLPKGKGSEVLIDLIKQSQALFQTGTTKANSIWLWGQGKSPHLTAFREKYGVSGAVITAVDLVRGIGNLIGWDFIAVPGATAYFDTNYKGKGEAAIHALADYNFVCVHIEAPDEAGHEGKFHQKIQALEQIDKYIIGPLFQNLQQSYTENGWRMLVMPDHPTPCTLRTHVADEVPFCVAGSDIAPGKETSFVEPKVLKLKDDKPLKIIQGHTLMETFINKKI